MAKWESEQQAKATLQRTIEIALRLGLIFLLMLWGFQIISPFINLIAWAAILAVALYPLCQWLAGKLGGSEKRAAVLITLLVIAIIILPTLQLVVSSVETARDVATEWQEGNLRIPAPTEQVKSWPLIGERSYQLWMEASQNLEATAAKFEDQIKDFGGRMLGAIASSGLSILKFTFATIIAGVFMATASALTDFLLRLSQRLVGGAGGHYVNLATATVRSVAQGVLGIAALQSIGAAIGLVIMGIPLAGLWALLVLMLAIVQLPPLLVLGPICAYAFSAYEGTPAIIFSVYMLVVSMSDSFLKPLLLGRGVEVPMLVILLGAIGGMLVSGIIGLFVGAVVLALIYQLFVEWLAMSITESDDQSEVAAGETDG
jgi:predicted PurR-regulated permease PerM